MGPWMLFIEVPRRELIKDPSLEHTRRSGGMGPWLLFILRRELGKDLIVGKEFCRVSFGTV